MKITSTIGCIIGMLCLCVAADADLLVSGVFDGGLPGGEPKVVELFATADIADLSLFGVGAANNGGGTDGVELILSGAANAGDFIYLVEDDGQGALGVGFNTYFGFTPALIFDGSFANGGAASINGDDAVEVFSDPTGAFTGSEVVIDTFGDINVDGSGEAWDYLDGWAYRNDNTGPDGTTFTISNWTFSGINVTDGVATNADLNPQFPIGTYSVANVPEPGMAALLVMGFVGMVIRRRRS
jgi:hypothetical protein